jgi:hypothetical protein
MDDDFTVTGDELDRCLDRAEKAERERDELRQRIDAAYDVLGNYGVERVQNARLILAGVPPNPERRKGSPT